MFGSVNGKKGKAIKQATDAIDALCRPYIISGKLIGIIRKDTYVAGYLAARIPGLSVLASLENGLSQSDAKEVMAAVYLEIYGDINTYRGIQDKNNELLKSCDSRFCLGYERGKKLMAYAQQKADIATEPDFLKALEAAKSMGLPMSNDMSIPLVGLDYLWFSSYMEQYL